MPVEGGRRGGGGGMVVNVRGEKVISVHIYHGTVGKISGLILGYFFN